MRSEWISLKGTMLTAGLALAAGCGAGTEGLNVSDTKIVGGQPVPANQADARRWSTVALTSDIERTDGQPPLLDQKHSFCSGTIVGPRAILTAAHCIQKFDPNSRQKLPENILPEDRDFIVYFGTTVDRNGSWVRASRAVPHPDWDPAQTLSPQPTGAPNDIGLLILESDIPAEARVAELGRVDAQLPATLQLAGFGVTTSRDTNDTGILRQVDVSVGAADAATKRIQVGDFGRGACAGDSGGPAYAQQDGQLVVVGATSTGAEIFGRCLGMLNYYTDARYYRDWIDQTIAAD